MATIHNTRHYAEQVAAQFPHLKAESVVRTCQQFMLELFSLVRGGQEILISSRGGTVKKPLMIKIYRCRANVERANLRAARGGSRRKREREIRARRAFYRKQLRLPPAADLFQVNP